MRVRIAVTVDIDAAAWQLIYGTPAAELRADIQEHSKHLLIETLRDLDVLTPDS